jgi:predicted component of type VI protein secretion system
VKRLIATAALGLALAGCASTTPEQKYVAYMRSDAVQSKLTDEQHAEVAKMTDAAILDGGRSMCTELADPDEFSQAAIGVIAKINPVGPQMLDATTKWLCPDQRDKVERFLP